MRNFKPHKSPEEIAKKHRLDVSQVYKQLKIGIPIEHEHTQNKELSTYIALQHLDEIPDYYTRLKKMELSAKKQHNTNFKDVKEDLRDWFGKGSEGGVGGGGWDRYNTKGERIGKCARDPGEPKPKCLSKEKAAKMSKSQIASAVKRKRSQDPVADRSGKGGKPIMVSNKIKEETSFGEKRFCQLCGKKEYKMECSYGPDMWDKFSIANFSIAKTHPTNEEKDHEYSMARSELSTIMNAAKRLKARLGSGEGNIEAWVQSKITKAADYLDSAADYVDSGEMSEAASAAQQAAIAINMKKKGIKPKSKVDEACWTGYKQVGLKKKGKKMVPNCVSVKEGIVGKILEQIQGEEELKYFEEENKPTNPSLWAKAKSLAKQKFDVYPSAYANGWASKWYKSKGGGWKSVAEEIEESARMPAKNGQLVSVIVSWRNKNYMTKMFFPQAKMPNRREITDQIQKVYPGSKVIAFNSSTFDPGQPIIQVAEETIEEVAAWQRKEGKNQSGGLNEKGRKSYERENPGSDLKAPSKKVGNPRRASFCARMKGMKAKDPDSRINKSLRAWNC